MIGDRNKFYSVIDNKRGALTITAGQVHWLCLATDYTEAARTYDKITISLTP